MPDNMHSEKAADGRIKQVRRLQRQGCAADEVATASAISAANGVADNDGNCSFDGLANQLVSPT